MASKAYVASMTVTELKQELKQRGLSTRGSKKSLRDRLERAFDEEELNDSSSESEDSGKLGPAEAGFNFSVPAESFLPADQIREDSPVLSPDRDKMIISVELSNKDTLEVYSPNPPPAAREGEGGGEREGPLVVAVAVPNDEGPGNQQRVETVENHNSIPAVSEAETARREREVPAVVLTNCKEENNVMETPTPAVEPSSDVSSADVDQASKLAPPVESEREERVEVSERQRREVVVGGAREGGAEWKEETTESVPHSEEKTGEAEVMEVDSSEPLQSVAVTETDREAAKMAATKGEEGEAEKEESAGDEPSPQGGQREATATEEDKWVIIEHPPLGVGGGSEEVAKERENEPEEERMSVEVKPPEVSEGLSEEGTPSEAVESGKRATGGDHTVEAMDMAAKKEEEEEGKGRGEKVTGGLPMQQEQPSELLQGEGKTEAAGEVCESREPEPAAVEEAPQQTATSGSEEKAPPTATPTIAASEAGGSAPSSEEQASLAEPAPIPPSGRPSDTNPSNETPSDSQGPAAEEVSEGVSMEVAVLVHAEEDDLSVFSTEAAEAQKIASCSRDKDRGTGSASGKARERARERDRDKSSAKHWHASGSSASVLPHPPPSSAKEAGNVEGGSGSSANSRSGGEPAKANPATSWSSPAEEMKHSEGDETENQADPPSKKRRRISAHASLSSSGADPSSIQWGGGEKRRRWGSGKQRSSSSTTNISSDILKDIIPSELEVGEGDSVMVEGEGEGGKGEGSDLTGGQENLQEKDQSDEHQLEWEEKVRQREAKQREAERARHELETRQRIEARVRARMQQADSARAREQERDSGKRRSPSPAHSAPSNILHVRNLTRPFTLTQLRDLLTSDGALLTDGFWTNNVKSHCIAVYGSKEVATTTRQRLHGLKWPSTNPKLLLVEFLSPEEVQRISEGDLVVMAAPPQTTGEKAGEVVEGGEGEKDKKVEESGDVGEGGEPGESVKVEGEGEGEAGKPLKTRRESSGQDNTIEGQNETKKGVEESATAGVARSDPSEPAPPAPVPQKPPSQATKLLDDLFRKTKATPSIYWLPLSEGEVQARQQEREEREAEREKRRLERQKTYEEERKREREREEMAKKEQERRIVEERERRARERVHKRSRSRDYSRSRSRSPSRDRYRDRDRRRR